MIIQRLWFSSAKLIESILPIWRGPFLWMHPTLFTTRLLAHSFSRFSTYSRLIACVFIYNLFTQCYTHNSLGWKINVVDRGFKPPIARSDASSLVGFRISSVVFMLVPLAVLFLWCGSVTSFDTQRCFFPYNLFLIRLLMTHKLLMFLKFEAFGWHMFCAGNEWTFLRKKK